MSWLSTGLMVAEVATNILKSLVASQGRPEDGPYTIGTVQWYYDAGAGKVYAYNAGSAETALTFALAHPNLGVAEVFPLPARTNAEVSSAMADFSQGQLSAAPVEMIAETNGPEGPNARVLTFTMSAVALGITTRILTGVDIIVGKKPGTDFYTVSISSPTVPFGADVKATDSRGNSVSASGKLGGSGNGSAAAAGTLEIDLPPGVELSPTVYNLSATLTIPVAFYERATAQRRNMAQAGLPAFVKQTAGAR